MSVRLLHDIGEGGGLGDGPDRPDSVRALAGAAVAVVVGGPASVRKNKSVGQGLAQGGRGEGGGVSWLL